MDPLGKALRPPFPDLTLDQHNFAMHAGQPEVATWEAVGELRVIDAQVVQELGSRSWTC